MRDQCRRRRVGDRAGKDQHSVTVLEGKSHVISSYDGKERSLFD